ncbi:hypothetical protein BS47DRAFT_1384152 [Hydnum rufescens UP504]|uniref:C2 NT-type domain-containing protein n=1 Tax=Hydnum rufescens UP504 TaxID=1448309 RepID=A0A9P6DQF1_9AGAM|nr:hypothetical protein BS47DRAFT_1384152 [Hydnum rufescens UP504]
MSTNHHPIRDHLRALLPSSRSASFHAQIIIHELVDVPLVSGAFAVKWRFQDAHPIHPGHPQLKKQNNKDEDSSFVDDSSEQDSMGENTSSSNDWAPTYHRDTTPNAQHLSPELSHRPSGSEEMVDIPDTFLSSTKGRTDFAPLQNHTATFNQRVDVNLHMTVDRETLDLHPCQLKFEVLQDIPSIDGKDRDKEALGVVSINLAEYARPSSITRRHLLRRSKVNALLKVTIELTQLGGQTNYIAPPLPEGQIMSGVSGLLSLDGLLHNREYLPGHIPVKLETFRRSYNAQNLALAPSESSSSRISSISPRTFNFEQLSAHTEAPSPLPSATTEAIIDALFNPYQAASKTPSPFTVQTSKSETVLSAPARSTISSDGRSSRMLSADSSVANTWPSSVSASGQSISSEPEEGVVYRGDRIMQSHESNASTPSSSSSKSVKWWKLGGSSRSLTPESKSPAPSLASDSERHHFQDGIPEPLIPQVELDDFYDLLETIRPSTSIRHTVPSSLSDRNELTRRRVTPAIAVTNVDDNREPW